jgi:hypothetical protein
MLVGCKKPGGRQGDKLAAEPETRSCWKEEGEYPPRIRDPFLGKD